MGSSLQHTTQTKGRHHASTEVRPFMAQSSHLAGCRPRDRSHAATRNRRLSLVALLLPPALGTAVMMAQINRKLCHLLLINPNQRKDHPNSSEEKNMQRSSQYQYSLAGGHEKAGIRHRDVDI